MKQLTILVAPVDAVGHVNACSGATINLLKRGHRVVFFIDQSFQGKLAKLGFQEYIYQSYPSTEQDQSGESCNAKRPGQRLAEMLLEHKVLGPFTPKEKNENMLKLIFNDPDKFALRDKQLKEAIETVNPDLIYVDSVLLMPAIYYSNKPWIKNISTTPLFYAEDDDLPPGGSGFPTETSRELWKSFTDFESTFVHSKKFNNLVEQLGYKRYEGDRLMPQTQLMTVHAYPEELNYPQIRRKGWFNLEVFNKNTDKEMFDLKQCAPAKFLSNTLNGRFSGKLIYLSMGSMGSVDVDLMKRLVEVLSQTNHKYIVSKGARHEEYQLADNMWGEAYLPQTKLVPLVNLVITHGRNNTVTETFAHGKPMMVLPLFVDQFDNAQRLTETGFGIRLDPYRFTNEEMISAINRLLYNDKLHHDMHKIAQRIQQTNTHELLCDNIESLLH